MPVMSSAENGILTSHRPEGLGGKEYRYGEG